MISLHTHSTFSLLDGYGTPKQIIDKCKSLGHKSIALTDHGVINGYVQFEQAAKANGIKPIYGCEFYIVGSIAENQRSKYHITVLAQNLEGYRNILSLVSKSFQEGFYYRQTIDFNMLKQHKKGLIVLSGCSTGPISHYILTNELDKAEVVISWLKREFGANFFLETQIFNLEDSHKINRFLHSVKDKYSSELVMTNDIHYLNKGEQDVQDVLYAIRNRTSILATQGKMTGLMYQMSNEEIMELCAKYQSDIDYVSAINNTYKISDIIEEYSMPKAPVTKFNDMTFSDKKSFMAEKIIDGWKLRNIDNLSDREKYKERMKYEFDIICQKHFIDYFLIVADMVIWAKQHGILVGPARGSAAGSLICYLMRITEVDPIVHRLIFERFIDITREDLPDIDLDFEDSKRDQVKEYLLNKYGKERVANIIAYCGFKGKSIIDDLSRVFNLPVKETVIIKQLLLQRSGGDARADMTVEDTFNEFPQAKAIQERYPEAMGIAPKLEGQYRQLTVHAAGIIVGGDDLSKYTAFMRDNSISYDHHDATYLNLLKIDVLGLKTLRVIRQIMDKIDMKNEELYSLPLDDIKVYDKFNTYQYIGVFQFGGDAINNICRQMKFHKFSDITEANALARPGALHCGTATAYFLNNRIHIHPLVDAIADTANGQILYQEQVMRIMREIGLMSWKDTAEIRKLISKSQGVEKFNTFKDKFTKGALSQSLSLDMINDIWAKVCTFGCLSGDTILKLPQSNQHSPKEITIEQLFSNDGVAKIAVDESNRWAQKNRKVKLFILKDDCIKTERMVDIYKSGIKKTFEIKTKNGKTIRATKDHLFYTSGGWKKLDELKIGDEIVVKGDRSYQKEPGPDLGAHNKRHGQSKLFLERQRFLRQKYKYCQVCFVNLNEETHHKDNNRMNNNWNNLIPICRKCHKKTYPVPVPFTRGFQAEYEEVISISNSKFEMTYDIAMPYPWNNYVANDFIVHNSWAFNLAHSVSYALLAYYTMFLKVYYPLEFYWSNLTADPEDINIIKEAYDNGIQFLPFDTENSKANWIIEDGKLRQGFITVKGIGEKTANALEARTKKMTKSIVEIFKRETEFVEENGMSQQMHEALIFPKILKDIQGWTHKINDLSFGPAHEAIIAGRIRERNLRSLKEVGQSKTGTLYNNVWHEEWDKWVNLEFFDDTGIVIATVPRQLYNTSEYIKDQLWNDFEKDDIYVIKGLKTKDFRKIAVWQLYNLSRKERENARNNSGVISS